MNVIGEKFKETLGSVIPIIIIVAALNFTVCPLSADLLVRFVAGGILLVVGLSFFLLGVDLGILPIGERSGAALTSKKNLPLLLGSSLFIGFIVTIAEPDVQVLAEQIKNSSALVNKNLLVVMIAVGIGMFVMLGLLRTVLHLPLNIILTVSYIIVFGLAFFCPKEFQAVSFDAGGATTGPMTVPFIMALGVGVAAVRSGKNVSSSDDSFGLTGIASVGPVAAVCVYGVLAGSGILGTAVESGSGEIQAAVGEQVLDSTFGIINSLKIFLQILPETLKEVMLAMSPLVVLFIILQLFLLKMPPFKVCRLFIGLCYAFVGLVIFLLGVNGGFMPAGLEVGNQLGQLALKSNGWKILVVLVGAVLGAVVVCAEPAVWILTEQVEDLSGGNIRRKLMLTFLSVGVSLSIGLSMLRVIYQFSLWYILIPGYAVALVLSYLVSPQFVGIAFDSGGVASGPMTSTFILSFTLGVSSSCGGNPVTDAFGVIALVAMTPLLAIQLLGLVYKYKLKGQKGE